MPSFIVDFFKQIQVHTCGNLAKKRWPSLMTFIASFSRFSRPIEMFFFPSSPMQRSNKSETKLKAVRCGQLVPTLDSPEVVCGEKKTKQTKERRLPVWVRRWALRC